MELGRARRRTAAAPWREVALVAGTYLAYSVVRNVTRSEPDRAFVNAQQVMAVQRHLGLAVEQGVQSWALGHPALIVAANYFYSSATFIITPLTLVFLYRRFPDHYLRLRRALAATIGLALAGYIAFPVMPPRLLDRMGDGTVYGFTDTLATYPTFWSFASATVANVSNQFAAMPSLHCGFALWTAWALAPRCRARATRWLALAYPAVTLGVVIVTGNHFVLDAVGAAAVVAAGAAVARWSTAPRPARSASSLRPVSVPSPAPTPVGATARP